MYRGRLDFLHDIEEFEPAALPTTPEAAAAAFWSEVSERPRAWGCAPERGPFVDDPHRAEEVAVEAVRDYLDLVRRAGELREERAGR